MTFLRYPHLERYGNEAVADIDFGVCHIFPKLDGTNASVWYEDGKIICGSRNRQLNWKLSTIGIEVFEGDHQSDNAGFASWMREQTHYHDFLGNNQSLILYGEWLVPHTLKTYRQDAWRKFYVFDVYDRATGSFLPYEQYQGLLDTARIDYIPCIQTIKNPSYDNLIYAAKQNTYLLDSGIGEGIVIKNYDWKNKYNTVVWAKIINSEFKEQNVKVFGPSHIDNMTNAELVANKACTQALIEKEYAKIVNDTGGWSNKLIPRLLHTVYHAVVAEELWDCLKTINKGSINFRELEQHCIKKVKETKPEIFS